MKVAIASRNRVGKIYPLKWLPVQPYLFVEPQNFEEYQQAHAQDAVIVNIGQNDQGLTFVRNFILEYFDEPILMLDDDVNAIMQRERGKLVPADITEFFNYLEEAMRNRVLAQIGISFVPSNHFKKIEWQYFDRAWAIKYINVPMLKINDIEILEIGKGLFEDYVLCLQMYKQGLKFATTYKYAFDCVAKMGTNKGGCQDFRNEERSREAAKEVMKTFGPYLVAIKYSKSHQQYEVQIKWSNLWKGL